VNDQRRRIVLASLGIAGLPGVASAQGASLPRVAVLSAGSKADTAELFNFFIEGLHQRGFREGRSIALEERWADYSSDRLEAAAVEIGALRAAVVVTVAGAAEAARRLLPSVPQVFLHSGDPVAAGLVNSYARPGRNATGISLLATELIEKRMEFLKQILPNLRRMAFLANPEHPGEHRELASSRSAAQRLGIEVSYHQARNRAELGKVLEAVIASRPDAASLFSDGLMTGQNRVLADFFLKHRIPSIAGWARFAEVGHLLSYGPDRRDAWRRLAYFVDKIVKGARPSDLPVELPTVFELVVNRRTAAALGLALPPQLLARADRVLE
jgi:putative ABC transport system substrate-binding protein